MRDLLDIEDRLEAADRERARQNQTVRALRAELAALYHQVVAGDIDAQAAKVRLSILSTLAGVLDRNTLTGGIDDLEATETDPLNLRGDAVPET